MHHRNETMYLNYVTETYVEVLLVRFLVFCLLRLLDIFIQIIK
jgi:hypothetical protein